MFSRLLYRVFLFLSYVPRPVLIAVPLVLLVSPFVGIAIAIYGENRDDAPGRGAVAVEGGAFGESFSTPQYLDQGWDASDSLWFYNTTQGSAFLPYDFFVALQRPNNDRGTCPPKSGKVDGDAPWFLCDSNIDHFRYLPQEKTLFNPDALPVGFTKATYKGKDYVGYTCAACHTGQVNFKGQALRIDGGPAMADMDGFLRDLANSLQAALPNPESQANPEFEAFADRVIAIQNDYKNRGEVERDLKKWLEIRDRYNSVNNSFYLTAYGKSRQHRTSCGSSDGAQRERQRLDYGYARLDAFGRIYNRILQHTINAPQLSNALRSITTCKGVPAGGDPKRLLSDQQIKNVMADFNSSGATVLRDVYFNKILENLQSHEPGFPKLSDADMIRVRNALFNSPNAPVSYPFLWDITRADFVQWNGLANNATLGPLGRNAGEVMGVFAILDWHEDRGILSHVFKDFNLPAIISGQSTKKAAIRFESSIDLFNLERLERKLTTLTSPAWPFCKDSQGGHEDRDSYYLPSGADEPYVDQRACKQGDTKTNEEMVRNGRILFERHCDSCHDTIDPHDPDRVVISFMVGTDHKETTDTATADNGVDYTGRSGNFKDTYQDVGVGKIIMPEVGPVAQILTAATKGAVTTTNYSLTGVAEWFYSIIMSLVDNPVKQSVKRGDFTPDTASQPFASLRAYRARPLNGIWATAPYLHNGSVPTLYDLLLPVSIQENCRAESVRPKFFWVGKREFDPVEVGFVSSESEGFLFNVANKDGPIRGNDNKGHEYGACQFNHQDRLNLIEYLKSL